MLASPLEIQFYCMHHTWTSILLTYIFLLYDIPVPNFFLVRPEDKPEDKPDFKQYLEALRNLIQLMLFLNI